MNPISDLRGEHDAMAIVIVAMQKCAIDIQKNFHVDLFRIGQIIDFLRTYNDHCHHEKEEKILFPALLECNIPWADEAIHHLADEHKMARRYLHEIDDHLNNYLDGRSHTLEHLSTGMTKYTTLQENHIKTENEILFPLSQQYLNKKKQENMYLNFKNIQNCHVSHPKNLEYYLLLKKLYSETKATYITEF